MRLRALLVVCLGVVLGVAAAAEQRWDSIRGAIEKAEPPGPQWFTLRSGHTGHVLDAATGQSHGTLTLSLFSPALRPHVDHGMVYTYGSFYSRTYYGDRTDAVIFFDLETMSPVDEVIIPAKAAGIGHSGMIGLIDDRFIGVWNITPAMSVSIVDIEERSFVGEISTPGCATVYPQDRGFLMICGDGALQYIMLDESGAESGRLRSPVFFSVEDDPIFDYSVPTEHGWVFVSLEGHVFEARIEDDEIVIEESWSVLSEQDRAEGWRISGRQPFAYNEATGIFMTLMHQGGTQDNYKDPGTELWAFNLRTQRRGYRVELDNPSRNIALTRDDDPVALVVGTQERSVAVRHARTGRLVRTIEEAGGLVQVF